MRDISNSLAQRGPVAWLEHFATRPGFFMASAGAVQFADRAAAETFLNGFAQTIGRVELRWADLRIEPLSPSLAMVGARYDEVMTRKDGGHLEFAGYFSGVFWHEESGWKVGHCHWSSPAAAAPAAASR
jgi:hypothetical protein